MSGDPSLVPPNQLWVEAIVAETVNNLRKTNLFESSHNVHTFDVQDSQAARRRDIREGTKTRHETDALATHSEQDYSFSYVKLRFPAFEGIHGPAAYLEWEEQMENVFDEYNFSESKKVRRAVTEFNGYALDWWAQLVKTRRRIGEPQVASWFELKTIMKRHFVPIHYNKEVHQKLRRLTQGLKSVDDYFQDMESLMIRAGVDEDEDATMARFFAGLNREIQDQLAMYDYYDLYELLHKAILIERRLKRKVAQRNFFSGNRSPTPDQRDYSSSCTSPTPEHVGVKRKEESASNLRETKDKADAVRSTDVKCFKCQGFGHYASECTNKKVMLTLDSGELISDDEKEEEKAAGSEEEVLEYPVAGQLLVTRRSLAVQTTPTANEQTSDTLVAKLELPTQKHSAPYRLQWLKDDEELKVSEQVTVPLSIGHYHDKVLCDIVPMISSHILLGRPWQYDKRAVHDGFTNRYSFKHQDKTIVLVPLPPQDVYADQKLMERRKDELKAHASAADERDRKKILLLSKVSDFPKVQYPLQSLPHTGFKDSLTISAELAPDIPSDFKNIWQECEDENLGKVPQVLFPFWDIELEIRSVLIDLFFQRHKKKPIADLSFIFSRISELLGYDGVLSVIGMGLQDDVRDFHKPHAFGLRAIADLRANPFKEGGDDAILLEPEERMEFCSSTDELVDKMESRPSQEPIKSRGRRLEESIQAWIICIGARHKAGLNQQFINL